MAHLYSGAIKTNGEFKKVAELTNVTFTSGNSYTIQIQNMAYLRAGEIGEGFLINSCNPFTYTNGGEDLYIKTNYGACVLSIAE